MDDLRPTVAPAPSGLELENARLRERLAEAESVLRAIQDGEIDAVVVGDDAGRRIFTLEGADHPYRMLVESMNEGAATLTHDGIVLYSNRRLASLLKVSPARLRGSRFLDWTAAGDPGCLEDLLGAVDADGCRAGELALVASGGALLPVHVSQSAMVIGGASLSCVIVTDLRLARHHAVLESAAGEVRDANERLREADRRKDEFLATLAHELRNPLAPIRAAAEVIKRLAPADARLLRSQELIERQVLHLARLVDDLLEVSRITLGTLGLQREIADLGVVLGHVADTARALMGAAGYDFSVDLGGAAMLADVDPTRMSQAISNVIENAIKYTPPGGRIALRAREEGCDAVVTIEDSGIGIAPDMLERIFDMFVQVDRSGTRAHGGLGIGLALSRRLIEMHGGTISAASAGIGRGCCITVRLPLSAPSTPGPTSHDVSATSRAISPGHRVLIVDDNRDAADSLRMLLEMCGHTVRVAFAGVPALQTLEEFPADLVLLDIGLPDLDGCEVARRIRASRGEHCPTLVAVSGWGRAEDKRRAAEAGFDAHFSKPADPDVIVRLLEGITRRGSVAGDPAGTRAATPGP